MGAFHGTRPSNIDRCGSQRTSFMQKAGHFMETSTQTRYTWTGGRVTGFWWIRSNDLTQVVAPGGYVPRCASMVSLVAVFVAPLTFLPAKRGKPKSKQEIMEVFAKMHPDRQQGKTKVEPEAKSDNGQAMDAEYLPLFRMSTPVNFSPQLIGLLQPFARLQSRESFSSPCRGSFCNGFRIGYLRQGSNV